MQCPVALSASPQRVQVPILRLSVKFLLGAMVADVLSERLEAVHKQGVDVCVCAGASVSMCLVWACRCTLCTCTWCTHAYVVLGRRCLSVLRITLILHVFSTHIGKPLFELQQIAAEVCG